MKTKHPSPFIYLKGIRKVELEYVVDFLYNGEAYIAQEKLNKFLETAEELKIKGLQTNDEDERCPNQVVVNQKHVKPQCTAIETKYSINQDASYQGFNFDSR